MLTGPSSAAVELGDSIDLECSVTVLTDPFFTWTDSSFTPSELVFNGGTLFSGKDKYDNFAVSEDATSSTMTIMNIELEEEGGYACVSSGSPTGSPSDIADITVSYRKVAHKWANVGFLTKQLHTGINSQTLLDKPHQKNPLQISTGKWYHDLLINKCKKDKIIISWWITLMP